jgi:hypothetical protein
MSPWKTPQLVQLVRGRPEETLLVACKTSATTGSPSTYDVGCMMSDAPDRLCGPSASGISINAFVCIPCSTTASS